MTDYLMEAMVQPELRREEKEKAVPVLLERITFPRPEKQKKQTESERHRREVRTPEHWIPDTERGVWEGDLFQRPADDRGEAKRLSVPMTAVPGVQELIQRRSAVQLSEQEKIEAAENISPAWPMLDRLRRTHRGAEFARRERKRVSIALPEQSGAAAVPALNAETLDRAVERDARRYDRGFALF